MTGHEAKRIDLKVVTSRAYEVLHKLYIICTYDGLTNMRRSSKIRVKNGLKIFTSILCIIMLLHSHSIFLQKKVSLKKYIHTHSIVYIFFTFYAIWTNWMGISIQRRRCDETGRFILQKEFCIVMKKCRYMQFALGIATSFLLEFPF